MPIYYNSIHELDYCLMCSVELVHIGADSARYIGNYMPNVSEWYDWREERNRSLEVGPHNNWYETFCNDFSRDVENKYTRWVRSNPDPREHANCTYDYLVNAGRLFDESISASIDSIISNFETNTDGEHILEEVKKNVPFYVETNKHIRNLITRHRKFVLRNKRVDTGLLRESVWATQREYLDSQAWARQQYDILINGGSPQKQSKHESRLAKAYRKIAKKSVQVLSNMTDRETTSAFINGEHVDIKGDLFTYRITKTSLLTAPNYSSHGLINIKVIDTETNTFLFNLCWYLDNTPPAEQLLGFMLHVRSGNEEEILRTGNIFNINRQLSTDVRNEAQNKLSKACQNTQEFIPYNAKPLNNGDLQFFDGGFLHLSSIHRIEDYPYIKEQLKTYVKKHVLDVFPQFNNFAYQRNNLENVDDRTVSALTNDFKLLSMME